MWGVGGVWGYEGCGGTRGKGYEGVGCEGTRGVV